MERDEFLARIRTAAAVGRRYRVDARDDFPARIGYQGGGDNLVARLAAEVDAVGGASCVVHDADGARAELLRIIRHYGVRSALAWEHPLLERLQITSLLSDRRIECLNYSTLAADAPEVQRQRMLAAELGITSVGWAIAETGTLAMVSGPGTERAASLLPPVHVAIVERSQILPDLFDLFAQIGSQSGPLPSNLVLITGPSKTGDLELKLTTGVHGPGNWHVIVIDG